MLKRNKTNQMLKLSVDTSCKQDVYLQSQNRSSPTYMRSMSWLRRGWEADGFWLTTFWHIHRVNKFRKGYEKLVVSFFYSWSRSPAKGMRVNGGVGTVAEVKLVPWISVW